MKLAFIGIGNVGFALANRLQKAGHDVVIAANEITDSVQKAVDNNPQLSVMEIQNAINYAEVVFLATPFSANQEILKNVHFAGKTLIDCTNPVGPGITHGLQSEISGGEKVQQWAPTAQVVKAFTIYGFENFANSTYSNYNVKPVMLLAGNDKTAKQKVTELCTDLGFEAFDTGNIDQALHLEHLTLLWVKMVRRDKHHPNFVWAKLEK